MIIIYMSLHNNLCNIYFQIFVNNKEFFKYIIKNIYSIKRL